MYFEIFKNGNLIIRGRRIIGTLSFDHELNLAPSVSMTLDGDWIPLIDGREEVKIHLDDGKVFWGIIWGFPHDKNGETITLDIRHVITEWQYRQISVNRAMSNKELNIVYKGDEVNKSQSTGETITASNFTVVSNKISKMKTADWVAKAYASAWNWSNGNKVTVTKADLSKLKKEEGSYDVTFSTAKGTSVTVQCEVVTAITYENERTKTNKANKETISATPFTVSTEEGMTAERVKTAIKAKAWVYRHKNQSVTVTEITTNFVNQEGEYNATAKTAKGTSVTVTVTVRNDSSYGNVTDASVADKLEDIYSDMNFAYPGWQIDFKDDSDKRMIDYVYSKQNKLEALTQTVELTDDLWWRVGFWDEKRVEIGKFGETKPYTISMKPSGKTNIRMIAEPNIEPDIENVVNVATVYSDKSDGGMTSLTLREIYMNPSLQKDGFPVVILRTNVNNERDYRRYMAQYPKLAPNNELEYAVLDEASIALESGLIIEGSYSFNDFSPFEDDGKVISDTKRIEAAKTVYHAVIKRLVQVRRSYNIVITTEHLPKDLLAGDKVRLIYDNKLFKMSACSNYWKKLMSMDDVYYITRINYMIDQYGNETNEVTLAKWLKIERETANY